MRTITSVDAFAADSVKWTEIKMYRSGYLSQSTQRITIPVGEAVSNVIVYSYKGKKRKIE